MPALRRAPGARSLSAVFDGHLSMVVIEGKTAEIVRQLLAASSGGGSVAEEEAVRWLGASLARLVAELLAEDDRWDSRYRWVDDLSIREWHAKPDGYVEAAGLLIWGETGISQQWIEPCRARLRVLADDALAYRILVGDSERRAPVEYGGKVAFPAVEPVWRFEFGKELDRLAE